eukprot:TRINITY_DN11130_c0_g1_i4.p1 TRINITY_DN11130_c0_g1~~TRINITY_DN11130_c0_g1_i4.p1  ORF type:complete len:193 (+),score=42.36 TRINITY_DN11130_c0_g1_i4:63-641(+)
MCIRDRVSLIYFWMLRMTTKSASYSIFLQERQELIPKYLDSKKIKHEYITEEEMVLYTFLHTLTKRVDYIDANDVLQTYYYFKNPECFYLTERTKTTFMDDVDPSNAGTKLTGLLNNLDIFMEEMDYNYDFFTKHPWARYLGSNYRNIEAVTLFVAFVMNGIMFATYFRDGKTFSTNGASYVHSLALSLIHI